MKEEQDDVKIESEDAEGEEKAEKKVAKLRGELAACRKEKQEYMDGWQRAKADYVNTLKRFAEDTRAIELKGRIRALEALLPALDALERAKEHLPAQAGGEIPAGFVAIAKQLESAFAALGVEEVGMVGEKFNPAFHEALGTDPAASLEMEDTLTVVLEKGWKISASGLGTDGSIVIRPAKVRVAHFANGSEKE